MVTTNANNFTIYPFQTYRPTDLQTYRPTDLQTYRPTTKNITFASQSVLSNSESEKLKPDSSLSDKSQQEFNTRIKTFFDKSSARGLDYDNIADLFQALIKALPENQVQLIKGPKWESDASVFKIASKKDPNSPYALKIHENKYPLCSHFYNSPNWMEKLKSTGHSTSVIDSFIVKDANNFSSQGQEKEYRVTLYKFSYGIPLPSLLKTSTQRQISEYQKLVKECTQKFLDIGVNPIIKDLHDILVVFDKDKPKKAIITDINCLMPCEHADAYSRKHVMDIVNGVVDKLVTKDYEPYLTQRPTLADLRNN